MDIEKQFKNQYARQNMTQYKLAQETGISPKNIRNIEEGISDPRLSTLIRITEALHCTLSDFFADPEKFSTLTDRDLIFLQNYKSLPTKQQVLIEELIDSIKHS